MEDLAAEFEWYADWAAGVSPLYERLARGAADDAALLEIASRTCEGQPAPQLLLGAVHALLLEGRDHPLAAFYPTCTADPVDPADRDPFPPFREFCVANETSIGEIVASRRVQTNDVGRSAVLLPAFEHVIRTADASRLVLVEIGASAGLNLFWDRYRYEYEGYGTYGDPDSPVCIGSAVRGSGVPPLPERVPTVVHRVGVDLNPLDVTDPADARWLRALVIPDQPYRHERLAAAIDLVRDDPPDVVAGDAREVVRDLLIDAPEDGVLCVFSTHTLYQLSERELAELQRLLSEYSRRRPVHWLSNDPFAECDYPTYRYVLFSNGAAEETRLAEYESYGEWIRWLDARS